MSKSVILGWDAPKLYDQFPNLNKEIATALDEDFNSARRLKIRGMLTQAEFQKAQSRIITKLSKELKLVGEN